MEIRSRAVLRAALMETDQLLVAPVVLSPLTAKLAEEHHFPVLYVGGFSTGAWLCTPEPLLGRTDMLRFAGRIARTHPTPVLVDGDAGFGEPMHAHRLVQEAIAAGIAGVHIEDQAYPKRAHYHRDYQERSVPVPDMVDKLRAARAGAAADPDFVIVGRTDAMKTVGYDEGVARCNLYLEAGVDAVMCFPNDLAEAERAPQDIAGPVAYVNSWGNRVGRPLLSVAQAAAFGYRILIDAQGALLAAVAAVRAAYASLAHDGLSFPARDHGIALRRDIEDAIGLEALYAIEEQTVENASP